LKETLKNYLESKSEIETEANRKDIAKAFVQLYFCMSRKLNPSLAFDMNVLARGPEL
jgi:hypothetical protein